VRRSVFDHGGLRFSYLDTGGNLPVLLILHAHWMGASDFEEIVPQLADGWRIVALDQRGHGETDHGGEHSVPAYNSDIDAVLAHLGISTPVVILGHSFGGMVANLYAAARPDRVRALIIEDVDVVRDDHDEFMLAWAGTYPTREALEAKIGERLAPYLAKSMREVEGRWTLTFDPTEVLQSEEALNGDHWGEWLSHECPALVIRAANSAVVSGDVLAEMARRRPHTRLVTINSGHSVHIDQPGEFVRAVRNFLRSLD
jgi:esterase